jgi:hypothetical protein
VCQSYYTSTHNNKQPTRLPNVHFTTLNKAGNTTLETTDNTTVHQKGHSTAAQQVYPMLATDARRSHLQDVLHEKVCLVSQCCCQVCQSYYANTHNNIQPTRLPNVHFTTLNKADIHRKS